MTVASSEDVAWFPVGHDSAVGAVRRAAMALADRVGFTESTVGEVGIVATELASNQVKHAGGGAVLLRACRTGQDVGVEVVALDRGPGMEDVPQSFRDGHSSTGTLGIGLGAVSRLATSWDVFSTPGRGVVITASFGPDGVTTSSGPVAVAGVSRPLTGEDVCGDAYAVRVDGDVVSLTMVDGLGHGPLAATASSSAVRAFQAAPAGSALTLLTAMHRALAGTRGAAVAVLQTDGGATVSHAGIGNISGHIFGAERRRGLLSYPGIAGGQVRTLRENSYELPPRAVVVLHSDGVSDTLDLGTDPTLFRRSPTVISALALRDFGTRNDDAGVITLRRIDGG